MDQLPPFDTVTPFVVAVIAMIVELPTQRIPNWLTIPGVLVGIMAGFVHGDPARHFLGLGILGLIAVTGWLQGWISGGTTKLLIAVGTLAGFVCGLAALAGVMVMFAFLIIFSRDEPRPSDPPRPQIPSSPFVLAGVLIWAVVSHLMPLG